MTVGICGYGNGSGIISGRSSCLLYIVGCSNRHRVDGIIRLWQVDTGMRKFSRGYGYGEEY